MSSDRTAARSEVFDRGLKAFPPCQSSYNGSGTLKCASSC